MRAKSIYEGLWGDATVHVGERTGNLKKQRFLCWQIERGEEGMDARRVR